MVAGLPGDGTLPRSAAQFGSQIAGEGNVRFTFPKFLVFVTIFSFFTVLEANFDRAHAATFQLQWADNSADEVGFHIERRLGNGTFNFITSVGANITSYIDSGLADNTTYCYRVNAFNAAGSSAYTSEVCGTTPAPTLVSYGLSVSAQGSGTVTSSPSGINCGSSCTTSFSNGTTVTLQAVAALGYTFAGWTGDADCLDGSVTMNTNRNCTATFTANPIAPTTYSLTAAAVGTITTIGSGSGKIISSPAGIDCGTKCSATFTTGTVVNLQAVPTTGSTFTGWSGDTDCLDGSVTMSASKSCSASFKLISYGLNVSLSGTGTGKITSNVGGINCGTSCSKEFAQGTVVALIPAPATGSVFSGWTGDADCSDGSITMNTSKNCTAVFTQQNVSKVGLYRPSTGAWFLMATGQGPWQGCNVDRCLSSFGDSSDEPLLGDWDGSATSKLGYYDAGRKTWQLDSNNNGRWDGCRMDTCYNFSITPKSSNDEIPLIGSWNGAAKASVGVFKFLNTAASNKGSKSKTSKVDGYWYFDRNGNGKWDGCSTDLCFGPFGTSGDLPVVGNWDGAGVSKIGTFTPATGMWTLDTNGNGQFDGCQVDKCFGPFGTVGDVPVVGDWNGDGTAKIGVFRAASGEWFLDLNGNGHWDGPTVDKYISSFGQAGDLPVVGKW